MGGGAVTANETLFVARAYSLARAYRHSWARDAQRPPTSIAECLALDAAAREHEWDGGEYEHFIVSPDGSTGYSRNWQPIAWHIYPSGTVRLWAQRSEDLYPMITVTIAPNGIATVERGADYDAWTIGYQYRLAYGLRALGHRALVISLLREFSAEQLVENIRRYKCAQADLLHMTRDRRRIDRDVVDLYEALGCSYVAAERLAVVP